MVVPSVAVVLPSYNEECIGEFLAEIEQHLAPVTARLTFSVVDDASSRPLDIAPSGRLPLGSPVQVLRNPTNLGHGPTARRAWLAGLAQPVDYVFHVDGDGQFVGADFPRLLDASSGRDGVVGVRQGRSDPWFRRVLSLGARVVVGAGPDCADANSPLRIYARATVVRLLDRVAADTVVPHLQFSVLHTLLRLDVAEVGVTHQARRGASAVGTTWQRGSRSPRWPSGRLLRLAGRAVVEVVTCRMSRGVTHPRREPVASRA